MFSRRKFLWTLGGTLELATFSVLAAGPRDFWSREVSFRAFEASVGNHFVVGSSSSKGAFLSLELVRVQEKIGRIRNQLHSESEIAGYERFSLIFRGPLEMPLEQGIYRFKNGRLGILNIFVVPVLLPDRRYQHYEAIFNRPNCGPDRQLASPLGRAG